MEGRCGREDEEGRQGLVDHEEEVEEHKNFKKASSKIGASQCGELYAIRLPGQDMEGERS